MVHKSTQKLIASMTDYMGKNQVPDYVRRLWSEFLARNQRNSKYTLRAFSRDLGLDLGHLTRVLTGRRTLRPLTAHRVKERLLLDENEGMSFVHSAFVSNKRRKPRITSQVA